MLFASDLDWTTIIVAAIGIVPATLAALLSFRVHRQVRTPSGDTLGAVVERTHDVAAANTALLTKLNGGPEACGGDVHA